MSNASTLVKLKKVLASSALVALVASLFVVPTAAAADLSWVSADAAKLVESRNTLSETTNKCVFGTMLLRAAQITPESGEHGFSDVPAWCDDVAFTLKNLNVYNGRSAGILGMDNMAKAEQVVSLVRMLAPEQEALDNCSIDSRYDSELAAVNPWGHKQACYAFQQQILRGTQSGALDLTGTSNKGVAATMICRAFDCSSIGTITDPEDEEPGVPGVPVGGDLTITLSDNSPDSAVVPGSASNLPVAVYAFTTGGQDVLVSSLEFTRGGLGTDGVLTRISVVDEDGFRLSNDKSFSSSEDIATVNLDGGGYVFPANSTTELTVVGKVGTAAAVSGQRFFVSLVDAESVRTTATVGGSFPVSGNEMEVASVDAATLEINDGGSTPDVNVGERDVEVFEFKFENAAADNTDLAIMGITLEQTGSVKEDSELANFKLYVDGDLVAETPMAKNGYVAFNFDDPYVLEDGEDVDARIHADILGGANETITFELDSELDVRAMDLSYGLGAAIVSNLTGTTTSIEAGEVTIVAEDAPFDELADDTDDVILGSLTFNINSGEQLELEKLSIRVDNSAGGENVLDDTATPLVVDGIFENFRLDTPFGEYDLDSTGAIDDDMVFEEDDLGISLRSGNSYKMDIIADVLDGANMAGLNATVTISEIGNATKSLAGIYLIETDDDTAVTDITPSFISFDNVEGVTDELVVTAITQSATKTAVVGSKGVNAMRFELEAGAAGQICVDEITFEGVNSAGAGLFNSSVVSQLALYMGDDTTPLDTLSGSRIDANERFTFEFTETCIPADSDKEFWVGIDLVDDSTNAGDELTIQINDIEADDADNNSVTAKNSAAADLSSADPEVSTRSVSIEATGALAIAVDNSDALVDSPKHVLAGTTSDYVASFELTATNEAIEIKELTLTDLLAALDLKDVLSEVIIYDESFNEVARERVTAAGSVVTFEDIDTSSNPLVIEEGSENIYVKVVALEFGKDKAADVAEMFTDMNFALTVTDAQGVASNDTITAVITGASNRFDVIPVQVTGIEYVSSFGGISVDTTFGNGENVVAILKVTPAAHTSTDTVNGDRLELEIDTLRLNYTSTEADVDMNGTTVGSAAPTIERINGSNGEVAGTLTGGIIEFTGLAGADFELDSSEVAHYAIKITVNATLGDGDTDDSFRTSLRNLNSDAVAPNEALIYSYDDDNIVTAPADINFPRFEETRLDGPQLRG